MQRLDAPGLHLSSLNSNMKMSKCPRGCQFADIDVSLPTRQAAIFLTCGAGQSSARRFGMGKQLDKSSLD
jgi:hypothetical protein